MFANIEQKAKEIEFVKAHNAMTGQEAHDALSVKYGKEGKPVPQYDWQTRLTTAKKEC